MILPSNIMESNVFVPMQYDSPVAYSKYRWRER